MPPLKASVKTSVKSSFMSSGRSVTWLSPRWSFLPSWFARVLPAVALAVLMLARPAAAQGTSELFPDPLSSTDVGAILDRIGLEGDARVQSLKSFESCVEQCLELRKGGIDEYIKNRPTSQSVEDIKARIAARQKLLNRFAAIESQLFDSIRSVAPESLVPLVERERARAERRRAWSTANPFLGRSTHVELADLVRDSSNAAGEPLPQDLAEQIAVLLATFEQQQTSLYRKLSDVAIDEPLRMASVRAERNITPPSRAGDAPPEPDAWQRYFKEMNEARAIARAPQNELRVKVRALLRETAKQVAAALPPSTGTRFRERFLNTAYPSASHPRDPVPPLVQQAQTMHSNNAITGDELATVESLAASHATRRNALNERLMDELDKQSSSGSNVAIRIALSEDDVEPEDAKLKALFSERAALDEATTAAIAGASEALASKVPAERGQEHGITHDIDIGDMSELAGGGSVFVVATATAGGEAVEMDGMGGMDGMDGAVMITTGFDLSDAGRTGTPAPIKKDQLDAWRERFGFSEDMFVIANLLLDDYLAKYRELEAGELAELKSLPSASPGMVFEVGGTPPPPATKQTIARQFELRRVIIDRMVELDREFIDGLATATGNSISTKELEQLKNTRERAALISADHFGMGGMLPMGELLGESKSAALDLGDIVREVAFEPGVATLLAPIIDDWDVASLAAFRERLQHRLASQRIRAEFDALMAEKARSEGRPGEIRVSSTDADYKKAVEATERAKTGDELTRRINEQALASSLAALPDETARKALRDAWNRKAWPDVFRDGRNVEPKIAMALAFPDLDVISRTEVETIAEQHRAEYRRIADEMIAANETYAKELAESQQTEGGHINMTGLRTKQDAHKRLKFERSELNEKTLRRLKEVLTPEQAAKLGDLVKSPGGSRISIPGGSSVIRRRGG